MGYFIGIAANDEFKTITKSLAESIDTEEPPRTPHITLAHLGKSQPDTERFYDVAMSISPFEISIEGAMIFSNPAMTHLVLPVAQGVADLKVLRGRLQAAGGFSPYTPHITVASAANSREGETDAYRQMIAFQTKFAMQVWGRMVVSQFHVFSSTQGEIRMLDSWNLSANGGVM